MQIIVVILLILAVLLVIFTLQNAMDITLNIFFWEIKDAPLVLVLISCIFLGYLISAFYFYPRLWKVKHENKQMMKFNSELKELQELNKMKKSEEVTDPEGIELDDDDDDDDTFFRD
ncbi:LapA family protein [Draconibacterium sp. IB214405]|uniref:LapA family protein n=1 Tax=Draconibacterium sp. IB214405 TaxID=3097352 RepID=UPI002A0F3232|nr:LapA family protein [Draconibacterium sp. IB214405]MDX8340326.1 LapA family protein [Draconibacterium sp. IB214405]